MFRPLFSVRKSSEKSATERLFVMLTGMTGFGQASFENAACKVSVQIQSVNRKFCEVVVNLPRDLACLETKVSREVARQVERGYVTVSIYVDTSKGARSEIHFNKSLLKQYIKGLNETAKEFGLSMDASLGHFLSLPEVITVKTGSNGMEPQKVWPAIKKTLIAAIKDFSVMRENEGKHIFKELEARINKIDKQVKVARKQVDDTVKDYRALMFKNVSALAEKDVKGLESAVEKEISSFAEKINTAEELKRLDIHLQHFLKVMKTDKGPCGRKLDFITQEINREINTLSAKSNDVRISRIAVDSKSELDKIREQLQNVE